VSQDVLNWLFSLAQFGIKFGLENIRSILDALGHPERHYRSIHVAGTNGKGSVTAVVEHALRKSGFRTGRYTSPHLLELSERFAVDGTPVNAHLMLDAVGTVRDVVDRLRSDGTLDVHPTFFEVTTATAFEIFRRSQVEVAVCEVGLGGRLDATNVLTPVACAITSIAFDHEQYLGRMLADIAAEKAGIIKPHTPVVVGNVGDEAAEPIRRAAREASAPVVWAAEGVRVGSATRLADGTQQFTLRTPVRDYGKVHFALAGRHQVDNAVVAVRLLEVLESVGLAISSESIRNALASVHWPGRLERIQRADGREVLLDAAHNVAGAAALADFLSTLEGKRPLVFAAMRDKDVDGMLAALAPHASMIVATQASNPRSHDPATLAAIARRVAPGATVEIAATPAEALERAWSASSRVVVAGSIFLLADVMKELGRS
jgi:dihydrofolate synthase/folylpolyglutamate synthase